MAIEATHDINTVAGARDGYLGGLPVADERGNPLDFRADAYEQPRNVIYSPSNLRAGSRKS
jgi:hypothetical protein